MRILKNVLYAGALVISGLLILAIEIPVHFLLMLKHAGQDVAKAVRESWV